MLIGGLAMLVLGGALAERGAVGVAEAIGLSEAVIGLTVVAIATSLPELATSLMAARRGQVDIAVGNVVGSNLFNILLVLGVTATITPTPVPQGGLRALSAMLMLALVLVPMSKTTSGFDQQTRGCRAADPLRREPHLRSRSLRLTGCRNPRSGGSSKPTTLQCKKKKPSAPLPRRGRQMFSRVAWRHRGGVRSLLPVRKRTKKRPRRIDPKETT